MLPPWASLWKPPGWSHHPHQRTQCNWYNTQGLCNQYGPSLIPIWWKQSEQLHKDWDAKSGWNGREALACDRKTGEMFEQEKTLRKNEGESREARVTSSLRVKVWWWPTYVSSFWCMWVSCQILHSSANKTLQSSVSKIPSLPARLSHLLSLTLTDSKEEQGLVTHKAKTLFMHFLKS